MPSEERTESKVPRARLSQIAARKLAAFGIPCRTGTDGETLEGEITFKSGAVHNPLQGAPLARAGFVVLGHDRLSFTEPPLSGLGPIGFYDAETAAALDARISAALGQRVMSVKKVLERMKALKMETQVDPDRMLARGTVRTTGHAFELWGGPDEIRVGRVLPTGGKAFEVPRSLGAISLDAFPTPTDLEIHLTGSVPAWQQARAATEESLPPEASAQVAPRTLKPIPPADLALTVGALKRFGDGVVVTYGAKLEVTQEFDLEGARHRFVAVHEKGQTFSGRVLAPTGEKWAERFDLLRFPGVSTLMASVLQLQPATSSTAKPAGKPAEATEIPDHLAPHEGEIWVMNVLIEQESNGEVRYVGMNTDGKPYGATRILKRADFENVFALHKGGWRLNIVIEGLQEGAVLYRQLDSQRQPRGTQKKLATSILVNTFVPESAAY